MLPTVVFSLQRVREEASEMRLRATAALMSASAQVQDAEQNRLAERAYFTQRFEERKVGTYRPWYNIGRCLREMVMHDCRGLELELEPWN